MPRCLERSMSLRSGEIIITDDVEARAEELKEELIGSRVVLFVREKFLIEDAKSVIAEAFISEEREKYIIIAAREYNIYSQNSLLKILEEPPRNIIFILISPSKSSILPTIRSRLPVKKENTPSSIPSLEIDLKRLDLQSVFEFVSKHKNSSRNELKQLVEALYLQALRQGVRLKEREIENFDTAYRLTELNARGSSVLLLILMGLLHEN